MNSIQSFVKTKLEEQYPPDPTVPISFRGHKFTVINADILAKLLGYSTRSKLLSDLVPTALSQAIDALPPELLKEYNSEFARARKEMCAQQQELKKSK